MQDKIEQTLRNATGWMTAGDIAEQVNARSVANVGLFLKNNPKAISRTSPTRRDVNGHPQKEWRHIDNVFADEPKVEKKDGVNIDAIHSGKPAGFTKTEPKPRPTDKTCCNAAAVVATTAGSENAKLKAQLKLAEEQRDQHFGSLETAQAELKQWRAMAAHLGCDSPNAVASKVAQLIHDLENEKCAARLQHEAVKGLEKKIEQMTSENSQAVDVATAAAGFLVVPPGKKPRVCTKPESAVSSAKAAAHALRKKVRVFAMVHVGEAVPGSTYIERKVA